MAGLRYTQVSRYTPRSSIVVTRDALFQKKHKLDRQTIQFPRNDAQHRVRQFNLWPYYDKISILSVCGWGMFLGDACMFSYRHGFLFLTSQIFFPRFANTIYERFISSRDMAPVTYNSGAMPVSAVSAAPTDFQLALALTITRSKPPNLSIVGESGISLRLRFYTH